jgi:dTDP-4-dehydrorhamnose reductase
MKILVTGAGGMLGQTLVPCLEKRGHDVTAFVKANLDVTDFKQVQSTLASVPKLDLVIHCAAYTKVDQAESEPELANLVNGQGTENVAMACKQLGLPMLYVSTDYVFDGERNPSEHRPYEPTDKTNPLSVYGKSKLAGETAVQRHLNQFYIVRTSWLYGPYGKNFVDTIRSLAEQNKPLRVVSDQVGSPTYTLSLSNIIADLIETKRWGIYHGTDDGAASWFDFAQNIVKDLGVPVTPITTQEMPRPATRPKYSVLDKSTLISAIGRPLPSWQEALQSYLQLRASCLPR